ncbi:MAG: hypothetical protein NZL92_09255 [Gloeomargarita sp. SKYG116]|nr:hypothetical protein [Gloeomargarita sp. SKYG116]MCS7226937.1 hypothetical protein [Gloeomargarita sp. SKYB31]MDW8401869.1 hypothetical protein [Gloeomargarita sp. SKYGB_i_bin116]
MLNQRLTSALRRRDIQAATAVVAEMSQVMTPRQIIQHILAAAERLAWDEGDTQVARWLLSDAAQRLYG